MEIDKFSRLLILVETEPSKKGVPNIKRVVEGASVPSNLSRAARDQTLRKLLAFSTKLHEIVGTSSPRRMQCIDAAILRLQDELQDDLIDLVGYITTAARIAQIVIPIALYCSMIQAN